MDVFVEQALAETRALLHLGWSRSLLFESAIDDLPPKYDFVGALALITGGPIPEPNTVLEATERCPNGYDVLQIMDHCNSSQIAAAVMQRMIGVIRFQPQYDAEGSPAARLMSWNMTCYSKWAVIGMIARAIKARQP